MANKQEEITMKEMQIILDKSTDILCGNLRVDSILRTLLSEGAIERDDSKKIKKKDTNTEKVEALLDILAESRVSSYKAFMGALEEERPDLYNKVKAIQDEVCGNKARLNTSTSEVKSVAANKIQQIDGSTTSHSSNPDYDLEEYMDVEPDSNGRYTSVVVAAKPTDKQLNTDENYCMHKSPVKGRAYILNNSHFPNRRIKEQNRHGSQEDFVNMKHLFDQLGYKIVPHENLESENIKKTIKDFVSQFNDTNMSAVVVLMSHGDDGYILGTDDKEVTLDEIQAEFGRCQKLSGKPKLFFIQACRGLDKELMVEADSGSGFAKDRDHADMHIAYASTKGYLSLRSNTNGSWFIQAITEVFLKHAHEDSLNDLMNKVTTRVARQKGKLYDPEKEKNVFVQQTPERVSRMKKTFYFLPKYPA